jgi:hypothetical protein
MHRRDDTGSVVYLNPKRFKYLEDLERLYEEVGPDEEKRSLAKKTFDEEYKFNAGIFVLLSWIFRGKADWAEKDWEQALSMGALTVYLASPSSVDDARRKVNQKFTTRKIEAAYQGR